MKTWSGTSYISRLEMGMACFGLTSHHVLGLVWGLFLVAVHLTKFLSIVVLLTEGAGRMSTARPSTWPWLPCSLPQLWSVFYRTNPLSLVRKPDLLKPPRSSSTSSS